MKKFTLILLCAGMAATANAQKNSVLLFGDLNGSMTSNNTSATSGTFGTPASKSTINDFSFTPGIGYQFCDKWTAGVEGILGIYSDNSLRIYNMTAGGGIFARYTVNITPLLYFYTQADATYSSYSQKTDGTQSSATMGQFAIGVSPFVGINIKNGFGLNFGFGSLGYNYTNTPSYTYSGGGVTGGGTIAASTTSKINYSFGSAFTIGVSKNFLHKMKKKEAKPIEDMGGASDQ